MSEEENMGHNTGREWRRVRLVCGGEIIRKGGGSHAWPKAARRRQEGDEVAASAARPSGGRRRGARESARAQGARGIEAGVRRTRATSARPCHACVLRSPDPTAEAVGVQTFTLGTHRARPGSYGDRSGPDGRDGHEAGMNRGSGMQSGTQRSGHV